MYLYDDNVRKAYNSCPNRQRKQEFVDSRMISEDPRAIANLPERGFQKMYNLNGSLETSPFIDYEVGK